MKLSRIDPHILKGYVEVELNQAEIQALNTTPISIIRTPGSGRTYRVLKCLMTTDNKGTAFAGASTAVVIDFTGGTELAASATGFLAETTKHSTPVLPTVYSGTPVLVANEGLEITAANDMTLGDATSTLTVQLWWEIVPAA